MMDSPALQPLQPVWLWSLQPLQRHLEFRQVFSLNSNVALTRRGRKEFFVPC